MKKLLLRMDLSARLHASMDNIFMERYIRRQKRSLEKIYAGHPYLVNTFYVPGEICQLFDVETVYMERLTGFAAANGFIPNLELYRISNRLPGCACSYQSGFDYLLSNLGMPQPDGFVALSYACDDAWAYCSFASKKYSAPFFFVDAPNSVEAFGDHLRELYKKLKSKYRKVKSIEEVVEVSNQTIELKAKIDRLRFDNPGILDSMDAFRLFTVYNDLGSMQALDIMKNLWEKMLKVRETYILPKGLKILWMGVIPLFYNRIVADMEKRYGCKVVFEELFDFNGNMLSVSNFFNDLAVRIMTSSYFSVKNRLETNERYINAMRVDGVLHFSQRNCKSLPSMVPILRRNMLEAGIPFVEVSGDVIEPEYFRVDSFWSMLDAFFENFGEG